MWLWRISSWEAISIGMRIAGDLAAEKGLWSIKNSLRQNNLIQSYDLPVSIPKLNKKEVINILMGDKKFAKAK